MPKKKTGFPAYPCPACGKPVTTVPDWATCAHEPDARLTVTCAGCGTREMLQREFQNQVRIPALSRMA